jgi:hypothetical protein
MITLILIPLSIVFILGSISPLLMTEEMRDVVRLEC